MLSESPPERLERRGAPEIAKTLEAVAHGEGDWAWLWRENERLFERFISQSCPFAELQIAPGLGRTRKFTDGFRISLDIGVEVEPLRAAPRMSRKDVGLDEIELLVEPRSGVVEDSLKHPLHGEDGWARIDCAPIDLDLPHFASGRSGTLDDDNLASLPRKIERGHQPADPGSYDDDLRSLSHPRYQPEKNICYAVDGLSIILDINNRHAIWTVVGC